MQSNQIDNRAAASIQCREWSLYQKILNNNYMEHREIYDVLHKFLISYFSEPFTLIDLGCGDASFVAKALQNTAINAYCGIDLSETALKIAHKNMKAVDCQQTLIQGDFSKLISALASNQKHSHHLALASFALHHLTFKQKKELFGRLNRLLLPGGVFILIDITLRVDENRDNYLKRYLNRVEREWSQLMPEEIATIAKHMLENDFPETQSSLQLLAEQNNFQSAKCLYQNPSQTAEVWCFFS